MKLGQRRTFIIFDLSLETIRSVCNKIVTYSVFLSDKYLPTKHTVQVSIQFLPWRRALEESLSDPYNESNHDRCKSL